MKCPVCENKNVVRSIAFGKNAVFRCKNCLAEFFENYSDSRARLYSESYYDSWDLKMTAVTTEKIKRLTFKDLLKHLEKSVKNQFAGKK